MRRAAAALVVLAAVAAVLVLGTGATNAPSHDPSYRIELDNAFGLVTGAAFKVNGVPAGSIAAIQLDQKTLHAIVTVKVTTPGIPAFTSTATCDSEPQSLIGEYFISCQPGRGGTKLAGGGIIGVSHTTSTIPADLILDMFGVPERQRLGLIVNSLGAGVAARSDDLKAALDRALPALRDTDNLLALLDSDSSTLESLTANADSVVTTLAANSGEIQRFIQYANRAAADTAPHSADLKATLDRLPGFLAQLGPGMTRLGSAVQANTPALAALNRDAPQLTRLLTDLPSFGRAATPAIKALGRASVTGSQALSAAKPVIAQLNRFSTNVPELARNLAIVTPALDDRAKATEPNKRSPGGKGYTGLESLLQFAYNLAAATNYYGPTGHMLAVDGYVSAMCTGYATPSTIASSLKTFGAAYRSCYAWLGPNQPGVNETDPSNPSACVPDPGGMPLGQTATLASSACRLSARSSARSAPKRAAAKPTRTATSQAPEPKAGGRSTTAPTVTAPAPVKAANPVTTTAQQTLTSANHTLSTIATTVKGLLGALTANNPTPTNNAPTTSTTQSLLNFLLGP